MLVPGILHELADPEARVLVHEREAAATLGQSLAGELHASFAHPLRGDFDVVRARLNTIRDLRRLQRLGDLRLVPGGNIGVEQAVARTARPQDDGDTGGHRSGNADEQQNGFQPRGESGGSGQCVRFGHGLDHICMFMMSV